MEATTAAPGLAPVEVAPETNGAQRAAPPPDTASVLGPRPAKTLPPRTAVVYVHGMGSQRRFEDLSRLVEMIDHHARTRPDGSPNAGEIRGLGVRVEQSPETSDGTMEYIEGAWVPPGAGREAGQRVRFYEAYWAPIASGGVPRIQVVRWMFAQVPKPIGAMLTPWRHRARLRRSALPRVRGLTPEQVDDLFHAYLEFDRDDARREFTRGDFADFLRCLDKTFPAPDPAPAMKRVSSRPTPVRNPAYREALKEAAKDWRRGYLRSEWTNLAMLATLALAVITLFALVGIIALWASLVFKGENVRNIELGILWDNREVVLMALSLVLLIPVVAGFLERFLGDVMLWTTYQETNARFKTRKDILECVSTTLRHVAANDRVDRVVVIAHSLGTAIAVDAALRCGRDLRALREDAHKEAEKRLRKITHVVTYGSPIDKVHYLFEESGETGHRFNRVVEDLRGDIGTEPFGNNNGKRWIHWVNFWDRADIISGSLETPGNAASARLHVDNVEVTGRGFPSPGAAHSGYLRRPEVLDVLVEIIFRRTTGRDEAPHGPSSPAFGPGHGRPWVSVAQRFAALAVWAIAGVLAFFAAVGQLNYIAYSTFALAVLALLLLAASRHRTIGRRAVALKEALGALVRRS